MSINKIVEDFKLHQLQYGLGGDPEQDELYKWKLVTDQIGHPDVNAVDFAKEINSLSLKNLCYSTQTTAIRHFVEYEPEEYRNAFIGLFDENIDLQERVDKFISDCRELWDNKIKQNFTQKTSAMCDERLISFFLTLMDPTKYTFYKDEDNVGWHFNKRFEGKGFACEAAAGLLDYLFREAGARRIYGFVEDDNIRSKRLCERLGMRREGCFKEFVTFVNNPDGSPKYEDTCVYAILEKEWNTIRQW